MAKNSLSLYFPRLTILQIRISYVIIFAYIYRNCFSKPKSTTIVYLFFVPYITLIECEWIKRNSDNQNANGSRVFSTRKIYGNYFDQFFLCVSFLSRAHVYYTCCMQINCLYIFFLSHRFCLLYMKWNAHGNMFIMVVEYYIIDSLDVMLCQWTCSSKELSVLNKKN